MVSKELFTNFAVSIRHRTNIFLPVTDEEFKKEKDELFDMLDTFRLIQDRGERRKFRTLLRAMFHELTKD